MAFNQASWCGPGNIHGWKFLPIGMGLSYPGFWKGTLNLATYDLINIVWWVIRGKVVIISNSEFKQSYGVETKTSLNKV